MPKDKGRRERREKQRAAGLRGPKDAPFARCNVSAAKHFAVHRNVADLVNVVLAKGGRGAVRRTYGSNWHV